MPLFRFECPSSTTARNPAVQLPATDSDDFPPVPRQCPGKTSFSINRLWKGEKRWENIVSRSGLFRYDWSWSSGMLEAQQQAARNTPHSVDHKVERLRPLSFPSLSGADCVICRTLLMKIGLNVAHCGVNKIFASHLPGHPAIERKPPGFPEYPANRPSPTHALTCLTKLGYTAADCKPDIPSGSEVSSISGRAEKHE